MEYKIRWLDDHLEHHGILGQKWGVRRYQNSDGTWTEEGKIRYGSNSSKNKRSVSDLKNDFPHLNYNPLDEDPTWDFSKNDNTYNVSVDSFQKIDKLVREKCGDWYMSDWKSDALKKIHEERKKEEKKLDEENPFEQYLRAKHKKYKEVYEEKMDSLMAKPFSKLKEKDYKKLADAVASLASEADPEVRRLEKIHEGPAQREWYKKEDALKDKYDTKMLGQILNELGYENTSEAREYIRDAIMWD